MKTLLLLAGKSRRFWPLTEKSLFPVCGTTLLEEQIRRLRKAGCKDIILVGGEHNLDSARSLFSDLPIIEQENLADGMRGALLSALPKVGEDSVMIVGGNDVIEPDAYALLKKEANARGSHGAILAQKVSRYFPGGYLTIERGRIKGIIEKPGEGNEPSDLVNIVAHVHNDTPALLKILSAIQNDQDGAYERALDALFQYKTYRAVPYEGTWQPVKYPWHLLSLLPILLSEIKKPSVHRSVVQHKTAVVEGKVILEEGVRILPHATIVGPCVIGAHTVIGTGALVRGSSIGRHCVIGYNTEVKSSILADHVWTHSTYLGDSVISNNVSFGGGCMTGNFRLDEGEIGSVCDDIVIPTGLMKMGTIIGSDCRLGIQVGINPGVKIGSKSFVSGGTFLTQDIPNGSFARMKAGELVVSPNRAMPPQSAAREKFRKSATGSAASASKRVKKRRDRALI